VDKLAPSRLWLLLLFIAWGAFGVSMISVVVGMRMAQNNMSLEAKEITELFNKIEEAESKGLTVKTTFEASINKVKWANRLAILTFVIGIIALGMFVAMNLL